MKPLTRKEMLLDGAAKGNLDTFKPATREEVFIKKALDPKYLPVMTVNFELSKSNFNATSDKTFEEVKAHIDDGGIVTAIATYRNVPTYLSLCHCSDMRIIFNGLFTHPLGGDVNSDQQMTLYSVRMEIGDVDGSYTVSYSRTDISSLQSN